MTSAAKVAAILKRLGDAHYQAADELLAIAGDTIDTPESLPATAGSLPPAAPPDSAEPVGEGHLTICPAHRKPYIEGKFGPYCPSTATDPAWANKRGYCTVNPKNAAKWLQIHASVTA